MKKIYLTILLIFINSCSGYKPIFSSESFDYYISEIININNDNISRQIIKNLTPFQKDNGKKEIRLEIKSEMNENVITRDSKGDPLVYELNILVELKIINKEKERITKFKESFSFNNRSNKFELSQYKENLKKNLSDRIFQKIILNLQTI